MEVKNSTTIRITFLLTPVSTTPQYYKCRTQIHEESSLLPSKLLARVPHNVGLIIRVGYC